GVVLAEREEVYVRSARVIGASDGRILLRHIFPNIAPPLIVQVTVTVGAVRLSEAGLSFIGLAVQPPDASWCTMLNTAAAFMDLNWFFALPPAIATIVPVPSLYRPGDALRVAVGRGTPVDTGAAAPVARAAEAQPPQASAVQAPLEDEVLRVEGLEV